MNVELTLVTTNEGKFAEIRELLAEQRIRVRWRRQPLPEVQADDLREVVRSKLAGLPQTSGPMLVEDSGLFVESLSGFPGVYSSFVHRTLGLQGILRLVHGRPRSAVFRTVAGLRVGRRLVLLGGECRGRLSTRARGRHGFGFDPIFAPAGEHRTFAEMPTARKNQISHRAAAMRRVARYLARVPEGSRSTSG